MAPALRRGRRIVVLCEGDTEELAVRHFVGTQWQAEGFASVGLDPKNVNGHVRKIGILAGNFLDEGDVVAVLTLIDLQGMNLVTHESGDELDVKVKRVRDWLSGQVEHERAHDFFPHVSVHQVEAWILAEGKALSQRLGDQTVGPDPQAELKNFQKPPSQRINEFFLRCKKTRYRKIIDGQPLFSKIAFQPVYDPCRYFRAFYDDLRRVASQA
ncbi:MAG TPA: DUF4276 family protein [Terriglobia bacterium]|nr:DUF4276 family protein [Terriglobia bacterium]